MNYITGLVIALFSFSSVMAQEIPQNYCGTNELSPEQEYALKEFQQNLQPWMLEKPEITYYLPVQFHIVGKDDGQGKAELSMVLESLCNVNDIYAGSGIQFYLDGQINQINNSRFYDHNYQDGHLMIQQNNVNGKVNIYVVLNAANNCGYFNPTGDAVVVGKGCMIEPTTTLAHELGHYLSLPHTFSGWENGEPIGWKQERADGSNCKVAGDGFCDTPADYLAERWICPYNGEVLLDPVGDTVNPDETQIMSYSSDYCQTSFSQEQMAAMRNFIGNYRQGMAASFVPYNGVVSNPTLVSPKMENNPVPANHAVFEWNPVPKAFGYQVQISRLQSMGLKAVDVFVTDTSLVTTELQAGLTYYWRIRPIARRNTCTDFTAPEQFAVGQPSGITDLTEGEIMVYPNPVKNGNAIQIEIPDEKQVSGHVQLMDLNGKIMDSYSLQSSKTSIPVQKLSKGVYLLQIISDEWNVVKKITVQ